jgi:hypothetical protein
MVGPSIMQKEVFLFRSVADFFLGAELWAATLHDFYSVQCTMGVMRYCELLLGCQHTYG